MTDIVERLRSMGGSDQRIWDVMDEAANEIERLRKSLEVTVDNCRNAFDEADRLRDALTRIARGFCTAEGMKAIADEALEGK